MKAIILAKVSISKNIFWMISPRDYDNFFRKLRDGKWTDFVSTLEIDLGRI